mgnify:FL=1
MLIEPTMGQRAIEFMPRCDHENFMRVAKHQIMIREAIIDQVFVIPAPAFVHIGMRLIDERMAPQVIADTAIKVEEYIFHDLSFLVCYIEEGARRDRNEHADDKDTGTMMDFKCAEYHKVTGCD